MFPGRNGRTLRFVEFRLLGPLEVEGDDGALPLGGPKQRAALAHLLLRANRLVPAERLIDEIWMDEPPTSVRNVLQTYLSRLRSLLGRARLEHRPGGYILHADPSEIDVHQFEVLVQQARRRAPSDPTAAVGLYREADGLWRGPALDDLSDQPSLRGDIAHLEELRAAAAEDRIVLELALGRHAELVADLETLSARDPLREAFWRHLMTAFYRSGRQADALAAYHRAREALAQLGLEPSPELQRLERQVLQQDPALEVVGVPLRGFRVLERVGEGSFGVVHRALQPQVDREVAIKVVRPQFVDDPDFIRRFEVEAQLVARLEHPHIVPLYDYWREPGGAFIVMRLLRGGSLRDALADGPLELDRTLAVVDQVGGALASAHRRGIVHRDVKPANILFDEERNAYLSDFGIARDITAVRAPTPTTSPDTSSHYLSPEERRGEVPSFRSDVYSLGLVLIEMLVGRPPFADARAHATVPSLRGLLAGVPSGIDDVVRRATLDAPEDRYPDAAAFVSAVAAAVKAAPRAGAVLQGPLRNPYKGLRPFLEPDSTDFLGREALVERLVGRLAADGPGSRLLALVGPSGSGKSSAVRAGLIPALRRGAVPASERWFVATMVPGKNPFDGLVAALLRLAPTAPPPDLAERAEREDGGLAEIVAWALPDDSSELLLVIDQFEELFSLVEDENRRATFLAALQTATTDPRSRVRVVTTLRADFLDRPLAYGGFAELLRAGTELVVPLTAEELERAISVPARRVGATVDAGLVGQLVSDVLGRPSALPLLQFTLAELFDRRYDGKLSAASYERLGGVAGAVARGAEEIYGELSPGRKAAARQLFLRLVEPREGAETTRRRVHRSELLSLTEDASEMEAVIDTYARRRLLSFDCEADTREPTVELAHEAVLWAWGGLREWIEEARDDLRMQRQIAAAARDWRDSGREPSFFVGGARLEQLASWRSRSDLALTPMEQEFLEGSLAERDRLLSEDASRRARELELERRSVRRLRILVGVLAAAALVAGGLTVFAFGQRSEAERERRVAIVRELAAAANSNLDVDAERSVLLALEAVELARSADDSVPREAEEALHRAVVASRIELRVPDLGGALDWSPAGSLFVTEGPEESGLIDIRDAATGESVRSFPGHDADVNMVAFSGDGSLLATSGDDGAVNVWDPGTGDRLQHFPGSGEVWGVSFSPDGSLVAAAWWADQAVRIWDVATGRRVSEIAPIAASFATSFSPDGRRLGIATFDSGGVVADARSGEELFTLEGQEFGVRDVDWSPDGRWIATSSPDSTVLVWDARTGQSRFTLFGHKGEVVAADWSSDSRRLVTGSNDGTAKVWEVDADGTRELVSISAQERGGGLWVAFSPDGSRIMTGDQEITAVKIWNVDLSGDAEWANVPADARDLGGVAFTPDGAGIVVSDGAGTLSVWDAESGTRFRTLGPSRGSNADAGLAIDVSSDGLVAATVIGGAQVWSLSTANEVFSVQASGGAEDVAWSADGSLLATGSGSGRIEIVDRSGMEVASLPSPGFRISAVRFSPDSRLLAAAGIPLGRPDAAPGLTIWDWRQHNALLTIPALAEAVAFSPDGAWLATAPLFGPVRIWDVGSGDERARLVGHTGAVNDVAFSPDGSLLATGSTDGTVRLWDPEAGIQLLVLRGHDGVVWDVAFSPDGSKLASASPSGDVRVWALDPDDLVEIARRSVTRDLTDDECRQYLHTAECQ
jgi:WD40 repeat protein/serine/threonine protein kinase/DNA-binding winged helix-turn-helix (wHTH) protein